MRIKLIAEGSSKWNRFIRRWGISFLVGEDILFDTFGDAKVFLANIRKFRIDTGRIRHIVLSHDDWDYISGLWPLLEKHKDVSVYVCPGFKKEIKSRIASSGANMVEAAGVTPIRDGVHSTGQMSAFSDGREIFEQSLVVKTANGLGVICGCAHPGAADIVENVMGRFGEKVSFLAGGLHLKDEPAGRIDEVISRLKVLGVEKVTPLHCTGRLAARSFAGVYGSGYIRLKEGGFVEF